MPSPEFRLYLITDRALCAPRPLLEVVEEVLEAGVRGVQLREKDLGEEELLALAEPIAHLCRVRGARLLVNASSMVAFRAGAGGVHLPGDGPSAEAVRLQQDWLVGASVHSLEQARQRQRQGADFVVFSPVFPTPSKPGYGPAAGPAGLRQLVASVEVPVFALGGISPGNVGVCLQAGARGVAVMSGLMLAEGAGRRVRAYLEALAEAGEGVQ